MNITQSSMSNIPNQLEQLAQIYRQHQASEMMNRTLSKLLAYEAKNCQEKLAELNKDLEELEKKYKLSSDQFYQDFQQGKTDDRMDFVEWYSLIQMVERIKQQLSLLTIKG